MKPTATIGAMNLILAKRTHRAKNILQINNMIPIFAHQSRAAQRSKTQRHDGPESSSPVAAVRIRENSIGPYFLAGALGS
jgi:hypothetical protein